MLHIRYVQRQWCIVYEEEEEASLLWALNHWGMPYTPRNITMNECYMHGNKLLFD